MSDNIRRPQKGITADIWAYLDKHPKATAEQRTAYAGKKGWNPSTLSIQYKAWYTFTHGEAPPTATGKTRARKTPEQKQAEKDAKRAAREARGKPGKRADKGPEQLAEGVSTPDPVPTPVRPAFKVRQHPRACSCGGFEHLPSRRCFYCNGRAGNLLDGTRAERGALEYIAHRAGQRFPFGVGPSPEVAVLMLKDKVQRDDKELPEGSARRWAGARAYSVHEYNRGQYNEASEPVLEGTL